MLQKLLRAIGIGLGALVVALCLAITLVPAFLDRIYYEGPRSEHFDGARFFNPGVDDTFRPPAGSSRSSFFVRYLTGSDDRPVWPDHVAVRQTKPPARVMGERMLVTWIGHATVLVQTGGLNILTDPIYSDTAGPFGFGPRRVAAPGVRFENLPRIDLVLVSHNHYDHMDLSTLKRLWDRDRPIIITSLGNDTLLRGAGIKGRNDVTECGDCPGVEALDWGEMTSVGRFTNPASGQPMAQHSAAAAVYVTRNHHWGSRWFTDRNRALWSSFVVKLPSGNIFFAGDTGFGDGGWPVEAAKLGPVRFAMIPIGAFRFEPGQMHAGSHIGPVQASEVFRRLGAPTALAVHWGTFRLSYEAYDTPPKLLARVMACRGLSGFAPHAIGQTFEVPPLGAPRAKPTPRPAGCDARPFAPDLR